MSTRKTEDWTGFEASLPPWWQGDDEGKPTPIRFEYSLLRPEEPVGSFCRQRYAASTILQAVGRTTSELLYLGPLFNDLINIDGRLLGV